jgi:MFS family permease
MVSLTRDFGVMTTGGALIGAGVGVYLIADWALITEIVPRAEAARYIGVANIATAGGSAIARLAGGTLIDGINAAAYSTSIGYFTLYAIAAGLFLKIIDELGQCAREVTRQRRTSRVVADDGESCPGQRL